MTKKSSGYAGALSFDEPQTDDDWKVKLGFLIHDSARLRRTVIDEIFKPIKVTRSQAWLLAYLSLNDGLAQTVLAEQMGLGKVALGGLVDRLEMNEMIERRAAPHDRRVNNIFLTDKGRKVVREMRKLVLIANESILSGVSLSDLKTTVDTLDRLKLNLQQML